MNQSDTLDTQILDIMLRAGSRWVLWLLIGLSLAALAVIAEKIWFFVQERRPDERITSALATLRSTGPEAALAKLTGARSIDAAVARICFERASAGSAAVEEEIAATISDERARYEKRLAFLGTLGNNAPFVGLFGTVLGIIRSFHDISGVTTQNTQAVMSGIAEALVATGIGILGALPAVATYNAFSRHVETSVERAQALAHRILAHIKSEPAPAKKDV